MTSTDICGKLETEIDKKEIGEKWKKREEEIKRKQPEKNYIMDGQICTIAVQNTCTDGYKKVERILPYFCQTVNMIITNLYTNYLLIIY